MEKLKKNEKINSKQKKLFIVGVATFALLILGATYAYFQVGTSNLFGTSTINANAESIGSVILTGSNATLSMNLTAPDMMRGNSNITYYASSNGKTTTETEEVIGVATVSPNTDTNMYHCTYDLNITHSGTKDMYSTFRSEPYEATATGDMYGIKIGEFDTKALCEADEEVAEYISLGLGTCELVGSKYSLVANDLWIYEGNIVAVHLFSSQSECAEAVESADMCFKKYEAGDTYQTANIYSNASTGQVILTINGEDYDWGSVDGMPSTISGAFDIINPQEIELTAGLRIINSSSIDQTALAGTDVTISITASNLSCTAVGLDVNDLEDNDVELAVDNTQTSMSIGNNVSGLAVTNNNVVINDLTIRNDEYTINKLAATEQYKYYATPNGKTTTETLVPIATIENDNSVEAVCTVDYQILAAGNMLSAVQELDNDTILDLSIYTGNTLYNTYHKNNYPSTITIPVTIDANSSVTLKSKLELSRNAEDSDIESLYDTSIRIVYVPTSMSCQLSGYYGWHKDGQNNDIYESNYSNAMENYVVNKSINGEYVASCGLFGDTLVCTDSETFATDCTNAGGDYYSNKCSYYYSDNYLECSDNDNYCTYDLLTGTYYYKCSITGCNVEEKTIEQ